MVSFAERGYVLPSERADRRAWTSEDSHEVALFAAQCFIIIVAGILLYLAGPALGLALVVGGLVACAAHRRATEPEHGREADALCNDVSRQQASVQ